MKGNIIKSTHKNGDLIIDETKLYDRMRAYSVCEVF